MRNARLALLVLLGLLSACGNAPAPTDSGSTVALAGRTYILKVPKGYDGSRPLPLVIAIHGYANDDGNTENYFGLDPVADERDFFVVYPEGTVDAAGKRFFNGTDACCDFFHTGIDDVAFIDALVDDVEAKFAIDPARVYSVGHSNGGFLSYRLACERSSRFAAIVSLEAAMWNDPSRCQPTEPVAILEAHGTNDVIINPAGGDVVDNYPNFVYPPLAQTMADWATLNGCSSGPSPVPGPGDIDSETSLPTTAQLWGGCRADVELWTIAGGAHSPMLTAQWPEAIVDFLMAHPKPAGSAQH
jgi:polyhydroxybutyrate depolymerase